MKKEKEDVFTSVPVKDIVSESNRKIGGMGNIDILAEDIKQHGLTNPPTVVETEDGKYQVVAGRRRIEAVRQLKWKEVTVKLVSGDEDRLASIALSENVNRMEMHPLDEADYFKRLLEKGTKVEDIAITYDRTVSGIQHRIRLCDLVDGIKVMFREEKIDLPSAALLASLPVEDQDKFHKKYGEKEVGRYDVSNFMHSVQHCILKYIAGKKCAKCKKRTFNTLPGLFDDDFSYLEDVCFDGDCYAKEWQDKIINLIVNSGNEGNTEHNVIIDSSIPKFLPKKTETITLDGEEYAVLSGKKYTYDETKKKTKSKTAWLIEKPYNKTEIVAKRVSYKEYEKPTYTNYNRPEDPVKEYLIDQVSDIPQESQKVVAEKLKEKYRWSGRLKQEVKEKLRKVLASKRLKEENRNNLAAMLLRNLCGGQDDSTGKVVDFEDEYDKEIFDTIFGPEGITTFEEIPESPLTEKLFMFIITSGLRPSDLPDIDDSEQEWGKTEQLMQWKFLQITKEEYIGMYRELLSAAIKETADQTNTPSPEIISPQLEDDDEEYPEDDEDEYGDEE